jgi:pyruvate dehydrogenase E1 component beta subunit
MSTITYREAIRAALWDALDGDENVILLGEDIGDYGGVFKVTLGLLDQFGPSRVIETPIAEAGFVGAAIGAAITGKRPIVEIMFSDFLLVAADQLFNQAAKLRFISGDDWRVPLTIRTQQGVGSGTAAQHSQSLEALFMHLPGFAVAVPSTPADAKGLLTTAINTDDPTIVIEHKMLYGVKGEVPEGRYEVPFGKAAIRRRGDDLTLVSYSRSMEIAEEASNMLEEQGVSSELIDLRSLVPLDWDTVLSSVRRTGRLVVIHEAHRSAGVGAEVAARVTEKAWADLKGPVLRVCGLDVPVPYAAPLESAWLPQAGDVVAAVHRLLAMS